MLWGAFNNASTAMQVFTTDLGSISQNIANVNTTGYKRQEMMFSTVMSEHHATPTSYLNGLNIFGVQATQRNLIDAQGGVTPSSTWSDLAINGKGFFMVAPPRPGSSTATGILGANVPTTVNTNAPGEVMYTRDGSWSRAYGPDTDSTLARSYFVNGSGGYLLGWMADGSGAIPANAPLQPVYTLAPRPIANNGTSSVSASGATDPSSITMPGRATTTASILANLPRDSQMGGSTTTTTVTDNAGNPQTVALNWTRTGPYSYTVSPSTPHATTNVTSWTVTVDDKGTVTSPVGTQPITYSWDATGGGGSTLDNVDLSSPPARGSVYTIPVGVFDGNYNEHTVNMRFERVGTNSWYMMPDGGPGTQATPVQLTFDDAGQLISPASGLTNISMSWSAVPATATSPAIPAGTASAQLDLSHLNQYASDDLYIRGVTQDGYGKGTLMTTEFNDTGELVGYYDNGRSRTLFKVPVANFVSENELEPVSGTMFRRTAGAGDMTVTAIEDAVGGGRFSTSSLEASTVDIETEFTRMIMTQKAYSTNAQVFKTADEMTTTARDLKT